MHIKVTFYSYFKELTGCDEIVEEVPVACTIQALFEQLSIRFPRIEAMRKSTLIAVGVEYCPRDYVLKEGDEVALFPPVQGG